jgi:hypothetical protein
VYCPGNTSLWDLDECTGLFTEAQGVYSERATSGMAGRWATTRGKGRMTLKYRLAGDRRAVYLASSAKHCNAQSLRLVQLLVGLSLLAGTAMLPTNEAGY